MKPDLQGKCASKPPLDVVSQMQIGMRINANASVNARICIECALQVLCEQALMYVTRAHCMQAFAASIQVLKLKCKCDSF